MLHQAFLGRKPSHFQVNPIVKAYIMSEAFLWSAWQFVTPLFAVFVTTSVAGASVQTAGLALSLYLVFRVVSELIIGQLLRNASDRMKIVVTIKGMIILSLSYLGLATAHELPMVLVSEIAAGIGLGIASPPKNSLFSSHLDLHKEAAEWSLADAIALLCMALATALGGFIAEEFGFSVLFLVAAIVNFIGVLPYFLFFWNR
jgi:MFS family permease